MRTALLPDVPTIAEAGPFLEFAIDIWLEVMKADTVKHGRIVKEAKIKVE